MFTISTKLALANVDAQAQGVKKSSLLFTAAMVIAALAYGDEKSQEAALAIRSAVIKAGMWKDDKGTKQPSNKARRFMKAVEAVMKTHQNKARSLLTGAESIEAATAKIAAWLETFALSNNHYEGGVYLMPLTLGISKAEARKRIAQQAEGSSEGEDDKVTVIRPAKDKGSKAQGAAQEATAAETIPAVMQASAFLPALTALAKQKAGQETSNAILHLFNDLHTVSTILQGGNVADATPAQKALAKAIAKHTEFAIKSAKGSAKKAA